MTTKSRITTAIATGAVLLNALAPIALASEVVVSGNGVNSTSDVNISHNNATVVNQTNNADIKNNVDSKASTGGNSTSFNTGGDSVIRTGNATTNVSVSNAANVNSANVSGCGACSGGSYDVNVTGNGVGSDNDVNLNRDNAVFLNQNNKANIKNYVDANAKTGNNDASYNTGGDSVILTGNATSNVAVDTKANANFATIGGGNGGSNGSSVRIAGNGAYSDSDVSLNGSSAIVLSQDNNARIKNDVDANAKTGYNDAGFNTGGTTFIRTGDAETNVGVDNLVNFNAASVDCDCVLDDTDVKVAGNGVGSDNSVDLSADNSLFNDASNYAGLWNDVDGNSKTGANDASFGTGSVDGDPAIFTGDATSNTGVSNAGNANVFTNGSTIHLPGNWEMGVNFDLSDLWNFFGGWNA